METKKKFAVLGLIVIIMLITTLLLIYGEEAFDQKTTLSYPDGCSETYSKGVLITEPCSNNNNLGLDIELFNMTGDSIDTQM